MKHAPGTKGVSWWFLKINRLRTKGSDTKFYRDTGFKSPSIFCLLKCVCALALVFILDQ